MDWIKRVVWPALLALAVTAAALGADQVTGHPAAEHPLQLTFDHLRRPAWSNTASHFLTDVGLKDLAQRHPRDAFTLLKEISSSQSSDPLRLLTLAELAEHISQKSELTARAEAILWARDAAVYAVFCLQAVGQGPNELEISHAAVTMHNRALAHSLRLMRSPLRPGKNHWPTTLANAGIVLSTTVSDWTALRFDSLQPTDEVSILRPGALKHRSGLGVPVMVRRRLLNGELTTWKPYGPRDVVFAATAAIQPRGLVTTWHSQPVELVLHDALDDKTLKPGGQSFRLAADLTIPLTRRLAQSSMRNYEYLGLIDPRFYEARAGVYALDPYRPGRIPVVLVQGMWSSPKVWVPMLNVLRSDRLLRAACQFWVVLYPSGYPLPLAALSLRQSLREIRQTFDPEEADAALDQMVILGKSTGGQVARMLVERSDNLLWNAIFSWPIDQVCTTATLRAQLTKTFFFQPEPYVKRVIFVATGHRGSRCTQWPGLRLGMGLIRQNNPLSQVWSDLEARHGHNAFQLPFRKRAPDSIDGLEAGGPLLSTLDMLPIAPGVAYHSIIANIRPGASLETSNDGFIDYQSAHMNGAMSECIVSATHFCESDRAVITEVQRILHVHLAEQTSITP